MTVVAIKFSQGWAEKWWRYEDVMGRRVKVVEAGSVHPNLIG